MNKEFVPYAEALALEELGLIVEEQYKFYSKPRCKMFSVDEHGRAYPIKNTPKKLYTIGIHFVQNVGTSFSAPLYQQAFRWFREKYGLYMELFVDDDKQFGFMITRFTENDRVDLPMFSSYKTYEEAELACLRKLIELANESI